MLKYVQIRKKDDLLRQKYFWNSSEYLHDVAKYTEENFDVDYKPECELKFLVDWYTL
jgi:hypothetical protein